MESIPSAADLNYVGSGGITDHCLKAIARFIQYGDQINTVAILSYCTGGHGRHGLLLNINYNNTVAVKCGFTSGYSGSGPSGFSAVLSLLSRHCDEIDEFAVEEGVLERLDACRLTQDDLDTIARTRPVRPASWHDYQCLSREMERRDANPYGEPFPPLPPYRLLDRRLWDLAEDFADAPDTAVFSAYRRLEDQLRSRCQLPGLSSTKLFAEVFNGDSAKLTWETHHPGERKGRANLFSAIYMAYRNRRSHSELAANLAEEAREFLLINELFLLESEAVEQANDSGDV